MPAPDIKPLLEQAAAAYQLEKYDLAAELARKACRKAPASVDAWDFHGMACQEMGDITSAEKSYKKALKLARQAYEQDPGDGKMALRQIFLLMRLGRTTEIEELFALLRERHPDSPGLKKLIASYRMQQSRDGR